MNDRTHPFIALPLSVALISTLGAQQENTGGIVQELSRRLAFEVAAYDEKAPVLEARRDILQQESTTLRRAREEARDIEAKERLNADLLAVWAKTSRADLEITRLRRQTIGRVVPLAYRLLDELGGRDKAATRKEEFRQLANSALVIDSLRNAGPLEEEDQAVANAAERNLIEKAKISEAPLSVGSVVGRLRATIDLLEEQYARLQIDEFALDREGQTIEERAIGGVARITARRLHGALAGTSLLGPSAGGSATDRIADRFSEYDSVLDGEELTEHGSRALRPTDIDVLERLRAGRYEVEE